MKVLGYHISASTVVDSEGDVCSGKSYLEFLLKPKPDTIRVLYSLDYSTACLMSMEHSDYSNLLQATRLSLPPYSIRYVAGKFLSIKRRGAFSYYADLGQYVGIRGTDMLLPPLVLATRAKESGDRVYQVLQDLGIEVTSLTSPARAYEKTQLKWLYSEWCKADGDSIRARIIEGIGSGIFSNRWEEYRKQAQGE